MAKYIVLRDLSPISKAMGPVAASQPEPQIAVDDLTPRDLQEHLRDPAVRAIAPRIPVALITPVDEPGLVGAADAWGVTATNARQSKFTGRGVTVAVLDTGIDAAHPAFAGVRLEQKDFTGEGNGDLHGHGTHCSGTIFGRDIDGKRIGIAPGIQNALIGKVLALRGGGSSDMLFQGLEWAISRDVDVISMSLGFDFPGYVKELVEDQGYPVEFATSQGIAGFMDNLRMFDAIMAMAQARSALDEGCVIFAATGNESGLNPKTGRTYRLAPSLPAASRGIISVGALAQAAGGYKVAPFSNSPPRISAPGVGILSAKVSGGLTEMSGTSMACPHAAGIAALWWDALRSGSASGRTRANTVEVKLFSSLRTDVFAPDVPAEDRGDGLVTAP